MPKHRAPNRSLEAAKSLAFELAPFLSSQLADPSRLKAQMAFQEDLEFEQKMRPAVGRVYERLFPGCIVEFAVEDDRLRQLDQSFGIDAVLRLPSGQILTCQQKSRRHEFLRFGDFTQEFRNAVGGENEGAGEWYYLASQLYFYGWANQGETDFAAWIVLDVVRYKLLVERAGGLGNMGKLIQNEAHGRANFYAIPLSKLGRAILYRNGI